MGNRFISDKNGLAEGSRIFVDTETGVQYLLFALISIGATVIIISVITVSSIIEYVDLNGYGVNGSYTMLLLFSGIVTCVSLALIVRKHIQLRKATDKT